LVEHTTENRGVAGSIPALAIPLEILIAAGFPHWPLSWAADASTARSGDERETILQVLPESYALPPGEGAVRHQHRQRA
jgi:hypothetical protein